MIFLALILGSVFLFLFAQFVDVLTKRTQSVWVLYLLPLIVFTVTYGLRDGWFQDYQVYESVFLSPYYDSEYEFFFVAVTRVMRLLGFTVPGAMCVYAAFYVVGMFYFCSRERNYLGLSMAILVVINLWGPGQLVRWFMGVGMLYVAFRLLDEKKWWWALLFFIIAAGIHFPLVVVGVIGIGLYYLRPFRIIYVNAGLMLLSLLVAPEMLAAPMGAIIEHLNIAPSGLHVSAYVSDPELIDYFFEGDNLGIGESSAINKLRNLLFYLWFMVFGLISCRKSESKFLWLSYNFFCLSAVFFFPTAGFELMMRFVSALFIGSVVIIGKVLVDQYKEQKYILASISVLLLIVSFIRDMTQILTDTELPYVF